MIGAIDLIFDLWVERVHRHEPDQLVGMGANELGRLFVHLVGRIVATARIEIVFPRIPRHVEDNGLVRRAHVSDVVVPR